MKRLILLVCIFLLFLLFSVRSFNPDTFTMTRDDFKGVLSVFPVENIKTPLGPKATSNEGGG